MDTKPRTSATHHSSLRLTGFVLAAGGALLIGIGSLLTWVTVGIADQLSVQTVSPGTDLSAGLITLVAAVAVLVLILLSRSVAESAGRAISLVVIALGTAAAALAAWFIVAAPSHYSPVDDDRLVGALAAATGRGVDEVRTALANVVDELGGYTHVGPGPWVVIVGALAVIAGGVLTLRWVTRHDRVEGVDAPAPSQGPAGD